MDLDAMHRQVQGLQAFRKKAEEAIAFYETLKAGGLDPAKPMKAADAEPFKLQPDELAQIREQLVEIMKPLSEDIDRRLSAFAEQLKSVVSSKEEAEAFSDRLISMLDFFETNREGLEVLLSMDGEVDQPEGAGGPFPGAGDAAGAGSGGAGDNTAGAGGGSSGEPLPGTSQDASAEASIVVDQPAAKPV